MQLFSVGDKVRVIDPEKYSHLNMGDIYTVEFVANTGLIRLVGHSSFWGQSRFERVVLIPNIGSVVRVTYPDGTSITGRVSQSDPSTKSFDIGSGGALFRAYVRDGHTLEILSRTWVVGDVIASSEFQDESIPVGTVTDDGLIQTGAGWISIESGNAKHPLVSAKPRTILFIAEV